MNGSIAVNGSIAAEGTALLEVSGLSVGFAGDAGPPVEVTSGITFSVPPGQTLSLVGESGCGKSVTAAAVMQLLPRPSGRILAGSIRLRGREILDLPPREMYRLRGREMAMIFQEPMTSLNPVHTALDQVVEVLKLHRPDIPRGGRRGQAVRLLEEVEIPTAGRRAASYPFQLSGGMRQRVMIAMALAGRPSLLIADEPTTALDVTVQAQILELLRRVRSEHGMGMLSITHDMSVVAQVADRVVVMYAGQVVESGTTREVLERPLHPYTKGLMECAPRLDSTPRTPLRSIPGTVPAPRSYAPHCRYAERCPLADDGCRSGPIPLRLIGDREVRCIKAGP
jgi:peptide/nickel transport system ATP-binding protein